MTDLTRHVVEEIFLPIWGHREEQCVISRPDGVFQVSRSRGSDVCVVTMPVVSLKPCCSISTRGLGVVILEADAFILIRGFSRR
jgi:hypothetical protein